MAENIIRLHRPVLTPEERERQMKKIEKAAAELILATMIARKELEHGRMHDHDQIERGGPEAPGRHQ